MSATAENLHDRVHQRAESGAQTGRHPVALVNQRLEGLRPFLARALPKIGMSAEEFAATAYTAFRLTPKLWECDPDSFLGCCIKAAFLGLKPDVAGDCWILPYGRQAQFIVGYRGMVRICYRSPRIAKIGAHEVWPNDWFDVEYGTEERVKHIPWWARRDGRNYSDPGGEHPLFAYCSAALLDPTTGRSVPADATVLTQAEVYARRARSASWKNGGDSPWKTDEATMFCKTAIRAAWKTLPVEMAAQQAVEESDEMVPARLVFDDGTIDVEATPAEEPRPQEPAQEEARPRRTPRQRAGGSPQAGGPSPAGDGRVQEVERGAAVASCVAIGSGIGWTEERVRKEVQGWAALGVEPAEWVERFRVMQREAGEGGQGRLPVD